MTEEEGRGVWDVETAVAVLPWRTCTMMENAVPAAVTASMPNAFRSTVTTCAQVVGGL